MNVDNTACIPFQRSTNPDPRLAGVFDLREKWVGELKDTKVMEAVKIHTDSNVADLFTKSKCHARAKYQDSVARVISKALSF